MWDFDGDEFACLFVAGVWSLILAVRFFRRLLFVPRMVSQSSARLVLALIPITCLLVILLVLALWSDPQVQGHADYMFLFLVCGAVWVLLPATLLSIYGLNVRDDVVERNNDAAAIAIGAAIFASSLCYAGSNMGAGPTIWTTIIPAIVASAALAVSFHIIVVTTDVIDLITIDRHQKSAIILAAFLVGLGALFGWAMVGDWKSWTATAIDFAHRAWPAILIVISAIWILRAQRSRPVFPGNK